DRGCVIPWPRPAWVRIPPPAPLSPVEITNSNLSVGEYNSPFRLQIELARSNEFKNLNQVVARRVHGEVVVGGESLALQDETRGFREGERIAKISVWTLLALGVVEIGFSLVSGSISLLADGIDSISDAVVSFFVWTGLRIIRRRANRYNILSLTVDARNSIKDSSSSFVAFASVLLSTFGIHHADAIGGMLIAVYILTVAYVALRESSLVLLDEFHEPDLSREIEHLIRAHPDVRGIRDLRLRRAGPFVVGILEVEVEGNMTLNEAHEVATELETSVRARITGLRRLVVTPVPVVDPHKHPHEHYAP